MRNINAASLIVGGISFSTDPRPRVVGEIPARSDGRALVSRSDRLLPRLPPLRSYIAPRESTTGREGVRLGAAASDRALPPDARHPPRGRGGGQGVLAGQDRRLPPPRSSARRRVCVGAIAALAARRTTSSRPTASTATRTPRACTRASESWPSSSARRPAASKGLGGSMHMFDAKHRTSSAATASSAATCRSRPAPRSRRSTAATAASRCASSARARSTHRRLPRGPRARRRCGSCRSCFICENNQYSMGTPLYRSLAVDGRVAARARATAWRAIASTATTSSRCKRRIAEAVERARNDRRADARRGRDLPLPRPLDVATRATTARRTRSRSGSSAIRSTAARATTARARRSTRTRSTRSRPTSRPRSRTR